MSRHIPQNAFDLYVALGPSRSHQAIADQVGVSKKAVSRCAKREKWKERLGEVERKARERADEKLAESMEEMDVRQVRVLRFMQGRAIEAMKALPLTTAKDAMHAYLQAMEQERLIRGARTSPDEKEVEIIIQ